MAMNTSSPKNNPTLSAPAACALIRSMAGSVSGPCRRSAAPSAIGAMSGRTVWAGPPMSRRPTAAVHCRSSR